ncbi:MAG: HemK2/MTQ2 family protein methyltransferase [Candidatus Micrarchaeota archaeon]
MPIESDVFDSVYEPAEDTYLLEKHARNLKGRVLEIGCGSGYVAISNAKNNPDNEVIGVDINKEAVRNAIHNAKKNNVMNAHFFYSNLFSKVKGKFDAIFFNPPYLPTEKSDKVKGELNKAFDGGKDGRLVLDRFLSKFDKYLKKDGTLLLVQSSLNNKDKSIQILSKKGFKADVIDQQSFFFETLFVLRSEKKSSH